MCGRFQRGNDVAGTCSVLAELARPQDVFCARGIQRVLHGHIVTVKVILILVLLRIEDRFSCGIT